MERIKFANWIKESREKGIKIVDYNYLYLKESLTVTIYAPHEINFSIPNGAKYVHLTAINKLCIVVFSIDLTEKIKKNKK